MEFEETDRLVRAPSLGLLGDARSMILEDQIDRYFGRIGAIQQADRSVALIPVIRAKATCLPGTGGRSGAGVAIA